MMRIAFLGTNGPLAVEALAAAARGHDIVMIGRPQRPAKGVRAMLGRAARRLRRPTSHSLDGIARVSRVRIHNLHGPTDPALRSVLAAARPDLLCVASFPWLLQRDVLHLARFGAINVHPALLPRHRGILPLFWIYHADDRETGVTVHRMSEAADQGDILLQSRFELPRGLPVDELNRCNAAVTGPLLARALAAIASGDARGTPQDESQATSAPFVRAGTPMVAFDHWGAERTWHFLAGLFPRFVEPLRDPSGRPLVYGGVRGFALESHTRSAGSIERHGQLARLFCHDGFVELEA
jgi:methionyl-tRNA formyltransferase